MTGFAGIGGVRMIAWLAGRNAAIMTGYARTQHFIVIHGADNRQPV
jgi:hypothetical protein